MDFKQTIINIIEEEMTSGGDSSVFGSGVESTSNQQSGDGYATGDDRVPFSVFGGVLTRKGIKSSKRKKSKLTKKHKKKI